MGLLREPLFFELEKHMTEQELIKAKRPELLDQIELLGLDAPEKASLDELRKMVADALGIAFEARKKATVADVDASSEERVWIRIEKSKEDKHPVPIGVNGEFIAVERGVWVHVKRAYVEVLREAVQKIIDPETKEITEVQSYPFQVSLTKPTQQAYNFN